MSDTSIYRSITDIVADLSKPIAIRHLGKRKQGGKDILYISWNDATVYMNYFAPGWSYEIRNITSIGGKLILIVRVSIPCKEGIVYREATGQEEEVTDSWGDSSSNAEAQALKRACAKFGLCNYLYSLTKEQETSLLRGQQIEIKIPKAVTNVPVENAPKVAENIQAKKVEEIPAKTEAKKANKDATKVGVMSTEAQQTRLANQCRAKGFSEIDICLMFSGEETEVFDKLTFEQAKAASDYLDTKKKGDEL